MKKEFSKIKYEQFLYLIVRNKTGFLNVKRLCVGTQIEQKQTKENVKVFFILKINYV